MKLITSPNSPFGARVLIALKAKSIEVDFEQPPLAGLKSSEYLAVNPVGRIPLLVTESAGVIPESEAIIRFLDANFPLPSLFPATAFERAQVELLIRLTETYVMVPVVRLFPHLSLGSRDHKVVDRELAFWRDGLSALAHFMPKERANTQVELTMLDCILPPTLHLSSRIAGMLELADDPANSHRSLVAYYNWAKQHQIVGPILAELTSSQERSDLKAGRTSVAHRHI